MKPTNPPKRELLLRHPTDPTRVIAYGWEGPQGYYAVLFILGKVSETRESATATRRQARSDIIGWAIQLGFFTESDLDDASAALDSMRVDQLPRRLRTLVDVIASFKA